MKPSHTALGSTTRGKRRKKSSIDFIGLLSTPIYFIFSYSSYTYEIRFIHIQVILSALELSLIRKLFLYSSKISTPYTPLVTSLQFFLNYSITLTCTQIWKIFYLTNSYHRPGFLKSPLSPVMFLIWTGLIITKMEEALKEEFPRAESAGYLHMG